MNLVVTQAGGARVRVKEVEILNVDVNHLDHSLLSLLFHTKWTVMGSVGHWGHIHIRKNQYEANHHRGTRGRRLEDHQPGFTGRKTY